MDHQYRLLQRQAMLGDDLALMQMEHLDCRMGQHTVREDQIVMSSDWQEAGDDVAGCRCGSTIIDGKELCKLGHHHLYYNPWSSELAYRCVRPAMTSAEYRQMQTRSNHLWTQRITGAVTRVLFEEDRSAEEVMLDARLEEMRSHPYVMHGCLYKLEGDAACARGMHFLHITPEGRKCQNPTCSYSEADACSHPELLATAIVVDADGREVQRCGRCQMAFFDEGICTVFGHKPDAEVDDLCQRVRCSAHRKGTTLYEALAAAHRDGKPLRAICRENGRTLAEASGWSEKLRPFGVRKPTATTREVNGVRTFIGRPIYSITVRMYTGHNNGRYLGKREDYATLSSEQKEKLAGRWYPVLSE